MNTTNRMYHDRRKLNAPPPQHRTQKLEDFYQQCILFSDKTETQFLQGLINQEVNGIAS